ncbi:hypothetical protein O181_062081 [Austropuccinia psidii MF-1]|uniref:Uncharacterized protein n=1 Tax=Austropuccinia psidii MF-1 TaxID=1389203 RepID=A0A9Q3EP28_9BASI|nr:hypothetical protein [Austropuccinia psidii MF-1]
MLPQHPEYMTPLLPPHPLTHPSLYFPTPTCSALNISLQPHHHISPFTPAKSPLLLQRLTDLTPTLPTHPYVSTQPPNPLCRLQSLCFSSAT